MSKIQLRYYLGNNGKKYEIPSLVEFWEYNPDVMLKPITYAEYEATQ